MTQEEMWKAVTENDASYDGIFFYAVKSTGIYCRPSCKSKLPIRKNVCFFDTAQQARSEGFRPCKRCRSDLLDYQPIKEIAEKAKQLLDDSFRKRCKLNQELRHLGVSQHRMSEIFKDEYGVTLSEYVGNLRLQEAKRLLSDTDTDIIDIAYSVGFGGLSSFYRFFKNSTGLSPAVYRKEYKK
jgi:AraC family transcriptional regulator of adaptative response / methylphosphotriester-DNA alkyltransferase methyltransferase